MGIRFGVSVQELKFAFSFVAFYEKVFTDVNYTVIPGSKAPPSRTMIYRFLYTEGIVLCLNNKLDEIYFQEHYVHSFTTLLTQQHSKKV